MIVFLDTSAIVPLLVEESTSARCERLWRDADGIAASALAYVEVHTALAQAARQGRLSAAALEQVCESFEELWDQIVAITPSDGIIRSAARLGARHALRGYDAVQCATALAAASDDFVAVSGDRDLLRAWTDLGLVTVDTAG
ncbi:type II toxin-antitoxin system VapC family toxin [Microbacterium sp.]|uniref:type II toxin-antitoxin system VapC family toxin n=1 Tax=Microbacterium sp. TaxID=51671 RepID=UPI0039E2376F